MQNQIQTPQPYDDEIDLRELFSVLWAGKKLIVAITAVFAVVSVIYALSLANEYKASAVVSPANSGGSSLGAMAGQLGGLASLAGINIGSGESNETQEAMEIMQSWGFMEEFIQTHGLQVPVYAATGWDKGSNSLKLDDDLYDASSKRWLIEDGETGENRPPSSWELYESFKSRVAVSQDKTSGLINISVEYYSPQIAKQWVDLFVTTINDYMRARKLEQVNRNIEFLTVQIEKTAIADMREVFYQLIEEQTKSKMLAEASPEYAFVTVSKAMVPEEKSKPKRALVCILGTLLGGMLSVLWVLVRRYAFSEAD
ncbi:Wzz/FepE/Etk N-terminal domain-containing protein [SAR92 clade bacterium H455]|uniref:Wzz/FepE/Etk N-terminal domain-containing protein n=1 Tax=SAR92 clade bacterium H455 TaxID=2974818 RepID=A0ABY5TSQ1_9GAMM|nr:Wzz/FepE/Etk N-terminal domain-containing protein [SAR92 clade bacterium H455]